MDYSEVEDMIISVELRWWTAAYTSNAFLHHNYP